METAEVFYFCNLPAVKIAGTKPEQPNDRSRTCPPLAEKVYPDVFYRDSWAETHVRYYYHPFYTIANNNKATVKGKR